MSNKLPRVLIVGSTPISKSSQMRAFCTYLNSWMGKPYLLRQIYTRPVNPDFNFCESFYQITDNAILRCKLKHQKVCDGKILEDEDNATKSANEIAKKSILRKFFTNNKGDFIRLLRKRVWSKNIWLSTSLLRWVKDFNPDLIFLSFGDDFYLFDIALTLSEMLKLPIVTVISDDYYFSSKSKLTIFSKIYAKKYGKCLKKLFKNKNGIAVAFNSDKIKNKFLSKFEINLFDTVNISYDESFEKLKEANNSNIVYFGNFDFGRGKTILQFANELSKLKSESKLIICGETKNKKLEKQFRKNKSIIFKGFTNYNDIQKYTNESKYLLIAESFKNKYAKQVEYALSTKTADCLISSKPIIAIGNKECGVINYLFDNKCAYICSSKKQLKPFIKSINQPKEDITIITSNALKLAKKNHSLKMNSFKFDNLCYKLLTYKNEK